MNPAQSQFDRVCEDAVNQLQAGCLDAAEQRYRQILADSPHHPRAMQGLGVVLFQQGQHAEGIQLLRSVVSAAPDFPGAGVNLGTMLITSGRLEDAADIFSQAVVINPESPVAHFNYGWYLFHQHNRIVAISHLRMALSLKDDYPEASFLLGVALGESGDFNGAVTVFTRLTELHPNHAEAWCNLGHYLEETGRLFAAQHALAQSIRSNPATAEAWNNLGTLKIALGQIRGAIHSFRKSIAINPSFVMAHSNMLLAMHYLGSISPETILAASIAWETSRCRMPENRSSYSPLSSDNNRRIKIGIISADLRSHPVAMFLEPFLRGYDRGKLHICCYADVEQPDEVTDRLRSYLDGWISIAGMPVEDISARIRSDRIDLLFDIGGHTNSKLLMVCCAKPAPIQVSWLGYPGTTGLASIDFRVTDEIADPSDVTDSHYTEKLVRLPGGFLCYAPPSDAPALITTVEYDVDAVTFGCFNNFAKISDEVVRLWVEILNAVPGSRLLLKNRSFGDEQVRVHFERRFRRLGGGPKVLIMIGQTGSFVDHLSMYNRVDVALDTVPYNGTTTTCEALLMGVPVITMAGDRHASRVSSSILSRAGMQCCIATNKAEYVLFARRMAIGNERQTNSRAAIRARFLSSSICDAARFARDMEGAIQTMLQANKESDSVTVRCELSPVEFHRSGLDSLSSGNFIDAEKRFRAALSGKEDFVAAWSDLGIAVFSQGRKQEALEYFNRAVEKDSEFAKGWSNLGNALLMCGFSVEAVEACSRALRLQPGLSEARTNLGMSLLATGSYREAAKCLLDAALLDHSSATAWVAAGGACRDAGMPSRAASCYRQALHLEPKNTLILTKLGEVLLGLSEQEQSKKIFRRALAGGLDDPATHSALLMSLQYIPDISQDEIYSETVHWGKKYGFGLPWLEEIKHDTNKKLRVGYVSADFHRHPVGSFLRPILLNFNRERFSVFCYSNTFREDELTAEMKGIVDGWRVIAEQPDREVAETIRQDGIDILVDLSGHSAGNRLTLFARKAAPVQVSFLGYSHTTGLEAIDYLLSDHDAVLPGEEHYFTEQVVRLPHSRFCFRPPDFVPDVEPLPALEVKHITFGSFNNLNKVNESVIALWSQVLLAVSDSRLILKWKTLTNGHVKKRFINLFAKNGVETSRIEFRESSPHFLMMAEYGDIDIALDPFPFSGGLTTCEALWMGVPIITLPGTTPISRQTATFLKLVGLPEFIATSRDEYVQIAVRVATGRERLSMVRSELRERMALSFLCNDRQYTADLESAYLRMWHEACSRKPDDALVAERISTVFESASTLFMKGRLDKAEDIYLDILRCQPEHPRALQGLGMIANRRGDRDSGIKYLQRAIELKPDYLEAHLNLGNMLQQADRLKDAEQKFRSAIALDPDDASALANLGGTLWRQGRVDGAIPLFQKSLALNPGFGVARTGLLLSMNYSQEQTPEETYAEHVKWGDSVERQTRAFRQWHNNRDENRILRIGYVSADLGQHPVGFFMVNPVRNRTRSRIQVICYSNRNGDDDITKYFQEQSDGWRNIYGCSDDEVCRMIRRDRIDILVDLAGHTGGNRLPLFARQPVPVQVAWLGYPNTTGLRRMHYRLTDAIVDPPGKADKLHTEQLVRLPTGFLCFFPPPDAPQVESLPSLKNGFITFGSFNNLAKITPEVIAVWSRILGHLPGSRFIMKRSSFRDPATAERYRDMFQECGIDACRIDLFPSTETHSEHLSIYNSVDIALDSFPYNGTTTTCEALWMGVPVIVLAGERHAGRVGMSILHRVGLDEFVADDIDEYVSKVIALSNEEQKLLQLREFLRDRMASSPICNGHGFCLALENAYREMWKKWCRTVIGREKSERPSVKKITGPRRLNIGGTKRKKGWEIFSAVPAEYVDYLGDASDLSRFTDGSFREIYASHILEHFDYQFQLRPVLAEWLRVLEPGGTLYVSVPDMDLLVNLWADREHTSDEDRFFIMRMMFGGHGDAYDYHYVGFNEVILSKFLDEAGFVEINRVHGYNIFDDTSSKNFQDKPVNLNIVAKKRALESPC